MPLDANRRFLDFCGVARWHRAGYTGRRGLSATGERFSPHRFPQPDRVRTPFGYVEEEDDFHARCSALVHLEFAPGRTLVQLPFETGVNRQGYQSELIDLALPYIRRHRVDVMFISCSTQVDGMALDRHLKETAPYFTCFMSAGNQERRSANRYISSRYIHGVGAYYLRDGRPASTAYSSYSEHVALSGPTGVRVQTKAEGPALPFNGTSCAAPAIAGLAAVVNDFFLEKTGRPLPGERMLAFLTDCCRPFGDPAQTGRGAPVLPPPEQVDPWRYQTGTGRRRFPFRRP